jgi:CheY-specific phosphatase CheX
MSDEDKEFQKRYLEFCLPFVSAIKEVYSTMLETDIKAGTPKIVSLASDTLEGEYTALIGMNGHFEKDGQPHPFKGSFSISWPTESYLKVASKMLMDEYTVIDEEIIDVGMEICNITIGNAKGALNPKGYKIEMATPSYIQGHKVKLNHEANTVTISTPLESELGILHLGINYKES